MLNFREKIDAWKERFSVKKILERDIWRFVLLVLVVILFGVVVKIDRYMFVDKSMIFGYELSRKIDNKNSWIFEEKKEIRLNRLYEDVKMKEMIANFPEIDMDYERKLGGLVDVKDGYLTSFGESIDDFYEVLLPYYYDDNIIISVNNITLLMQPLGSNEEKNKPYVIGNKLVYKDIFPGVSIVRKFTKDGFKEYMYVDDLDSNMIFNYKLNVSENGKVQLDNKQLVVFGKEGIERFVLPEIVLKNNKGEQISGVNMSLLSENILEIRLDQNTMLDYPLLIDSK